MLAQYMWADVIQSYDLKVVDHPKFHLRLAMT